MTSYEILYKTLFPFTSPHYQAIRALLREEIRNGKKKERAILDVGGRKSPYTVGLDAVVTIIDRFQETEIQRKLKLGLNEGYLKKLRNRRSNIAEVIIGNVLGYRFAQNSFDVITAVEVIEHIENDEDFVKKISSLLEENGICLLTTPNGDFIKVNPKLNPDHVRHYTKEQFAKLLSKYFNEVKVFHFAQWSDNFLAGLKAWNIRKPLQTVHSMYGNFRSYRHALDYDGTDCAYLIAVAKKPLPSHEEI